ncbi:glycosyltransferase [Aestuariibius sp. 2305UL40-4]|uniref:glycosyltransferase n=1 Tax=Aestuariibius violaceus TaxID=3234132 RepID=UPI00345ECF1D
MVRIAVAAVTHKRPDMFRVLLESFAAMARPDDAEITFILVENGEAATVGDIVEGFRKTVPEEVVFDNEPRPGIPMVRNKALDIALERGFDFMTFVDDDERADDGWLVALVNGVRSRKLDLAGGPLRLEAADETGPWQEAFLTHLRERAAKRNKTRAAAVANGTDNELNIYTNNWCVRLDKVRETGIRFDEALQFTGGSDTKFSRDFASAGARIGWIPDAIVYDRIPARRLTPGYHFRRARDQSTNAYLLNERPMLPTLGQALLRIIEAAFVLIGLPLTGRRAFAKATYKVGYSAGRIRGILGRRSRHYDPEKVTGQRE